MMLLEPLISVIETVKERMKQHGQPLRHSEALTRYALIDPVLRALGWDTENPAVIVPEYRGGGGLADYALMGSSVPVSLLEAKKLGEDLTSGISQALNYCNQQGINYMLVSDGDAWVMYEVFRQAPIEDRTLVSLSIQNNAVHEAALKLLTLWRPNLESGQPVAASEPVMAMSPPVGTPNANPEIAVLTPLPTQAVPIDTGNWISLLDFQPQANVGPPNAIRFDGGGSQPIKTWRDMIIWVAEQMISNGRLTAQQCPVGGLHGSAFLNTSPVAPNGNQFHGPKKLSNGLYIDVNASGSGIVRRTNMILKALGVQVDRIELRLE